MVIAERFPERASYLADKYSVQTASVADAAENAVAITEQAQRKLESLDVETDVVWQERARLLEDARTVAGELVALVEPMKPDASAM